MQLCRKGAATLYLLGGLLTSPASCFRGDALTSSQCDASPNDSACLKLDRELRVGPSSDHVLIQRQQERWNLKLSLLAQDSGTAAGVDGSDGGCTEVARDPWMTGSHVPCCNGLEEKLGQWPTGDGRWHFLCIGNGVTTSSAATPATTTTTIAATRATTASQTTTAKPAATTAADVTPPSTTVVKGGCTPVEGDPWVTGSEVPCCLGLEAKVGQWPEGGGRWFFLCRGTAAKTTSTSSTPAPRTSVAPPSTTEAPETTTTRSTTTATTLPPATPAATSTTVAPVTTKAPTTTIARSTTTATTLPRTTLAATSTTVAPVTTKAPTTTIARSTTTAATLPLTTPAATSTTVALVTTKAVECTGEDVDPWVSGRYITCCDGLQSKLAHWPGSATWHYRCVGPDTASTTSAMPSTSSSTAQFSGEGSGSAGEVKILLWNVHWQNKDTRALAEVVAANHPDVVGLCEFTASSESMAIELSSATGRPFQLQPGRDYWRGYGTDIFYDVGKWEALEGGYKKVSCWGTSGGDRAANWVVLKARDTGKMLIAGGIHLTYCSNGCTLTHECELRGLYDEFKALKVKHAEASIVWMGDLNRGPDTTLFRNLLAGRLGMFSSYFKVEDLAQTQGNTYYSGGSPIDHILGEESRFRRISGGRTGQGKTGTLLAGADHFPVFAKVMML